MHEITKQNTLQLLTKEMKKQLEHEFEAPMFLIRRALNGQGNTAKHIAIRSRALVLVEEYFKQHGVENN